MKCERCGYQMEEETGVLICTTTDFRIQDSNGNLKFVISTHNLESDDEEIGESWNVKYCYCRNYITEE